MDKTDFKILLVEDDMNLGFVIQDNLKNEGYRVTLCRDGKDGLKHFNETTYDLCLLDVMLPKKDGFELAEDIRKINQTIPIIFLTAKAMTEDKVKGFRSGADDYITKPFEMVELVLRIEAVLKRSKPEAELRDDHIHLGVYRYDPANYELIKGENKTKLTKKQGEVLKVLSENKGRVVERELVLNLVWGDDNYFNGRSLDVFISKLRKMLSEDENVHITNVHGIGFKLEVVN
ncbi:MAG: response regulator transcription factor [Flavobacteriales bacterium]